MQGRGVRSGGEDLERLVAAAQSGDPDAFGRLVVRFQDMACAIAYGRLGRHDLAEEAVQDSFVEVFLHLGELRVPGAFVPWFRQVVLTRGERLRQQQARSISLAAAPEAALEPADPVEQAQVHRWVADLIEELPDKERTAVGLFYMAGCSYQQAATALDVPVSTVRKRLHDAREHLRRRMEEHVEDYLAGLRPSRDQRLLRRLQHVLLLMGSPGRGAATRVQAFSLAGGVTEGVLRPGTYEGVDWFPDGRRVLYTAGQADMSFSGQHRILDLETRRSKSIGPTWELHSGRVSPDGQHIAFVSSKDHPDLFQEFRRNEVYCMDSQGRGLVRLTHNEVCDSCPTWTPDGRILFCRDVCGSCHIYRLMIVDRDGSGEEGFPGGEQEILGGLPEYSPDGSRIAYLLWQERQWDLWVMDADGSHARRLTTIGGLNNRPAWSPDGQQIAFTASHRLFVVQADGSSGQRPSPVHTGLATIASVAWRPEAAKAAG